MDMDTESSDAVLERLALEWLDGDHQARLIVDHAFTILWSNRAAEAQLARRRDIERRGNLLAPTDAGHQLMLEQLLAEAGGSISTLCLKAANGDGHILFRAREIASRNGVGCFGLSFHRSGSEFSVRYADIDVAFGLTRSESRVLLELIDGYSADEVARNLGVSSETTRTHIRHIYAKLSVSSREELFSRIRPYRV